MGGEKEQKKRKTERKWRTNDETGGSIREPKTAGRLLTDQIQNVTHI